MTNIEGGGQLSTMDRLLQLKVSQSSEEHEALLARLRNTHTDLDDRRDIPWKKSSYYFHPLQDLRLTIFASVMRDKDEQRFLVTSQAVQSCFVKDFDFYISGFPIEELEMQGMFQKIFDVGTSFEWGNDTERVRSLEAVFDQLDGEKIQPWLAKD